MYARLSPDGSVLAIGTWPRKVCYLVEVANQRIKGPPFEVAATEATAMDFSRTERGWPQLMDTAVFVSGT
jgi:hypothetical protein